MIVLIAEIIPKWPEFRLVNYSNLARSLSNDVGIQMDDLLVLADVYEACTTKRGW